MPAASSLKVSLVLALSVSTMHVLWGYPAPPPKVSGTLEYFLVLLGGCPTRGDSSKRLDFLKPVWEKVFEKRSFRNGVGKGMKKNFLSKGKVMNKCAKDSGS